MLSKDELRPGDLLFGQGTGPLSWLIRKFDGSPYSHVGLYLGGDRIAQARECGLDDSMDVDNFQGYFDLVDVYRLVKPVSDIHAVLGRAEQYIDSGGRFAGEELAMIGILCVLKPAHKELLHAAVRILDRMDAELEVLIDWVTHRQKGYPMICSEFAYRSYVEACPGSIKVELVHHGTIKFNGDVIEKRFASTKPRPDACEHVKGIVAELGPGIRRNLEAAATSPEPPQSPREHISFGKPLSQIMETAFFYSATYQTPPPLLSGGVIELPFPPADFVSPGDLARSPSLNCVGQLAKAT
ncbi:MAG TPA: hypothetical protein VKF14_11365 [Candidatus Dormibacteraeota bacterium]|nr:hypothetical protein [Candidatus Dormibacteraeota bacterium]